MRIIDKTKEQDEAGNINPIARVQGTLKYGLNWYSEIEAQKDVIKQLDSLLEKGFVLIRNLTLPDSEIVIPMILLGTGSLSVILVSPVKGHFEARGNEWEQLINNGSPVPVRRNLVDLVAKLARVFEKYLERNKINVGLQVEPILIMSNPGAQVDVLRPVARVVRSDGIKAFATSLLQAPAGLRPEAVYSYADQIINPAPPKSDSFEDASFTDGQPVSRAQAIFNASKEGGNVPDNLRESNPAQPLPKRSAKKSPAMSRTQTIVLGAMFIFWCCIMAVGAYVIFFLS